MIRKDDTRGQYQTLHSERVGWYRCVLPGQYRASRSAIPELCSTPSAVVSAITSVSDYTEEGAQRVLGRSNIRWVSTEYGIQRGRGVPDRRVRGSSSLK
eukprot:1366120-Rhodomonas_salina.5